MPVFVCVCGQVGDYALVQVVNMEQATECYVPCIVQFTPQLRQTQAQFYTVMLYNGQKVTVMLYNGQKVTVMLYNGQKVTVMLYDGQKVTVILYNML